MDKSNLEKQLTSIEEFMKTPAYSSYQFTIKTDIAGCEASIVAMAPDTQETIARLLQLHGNLQTLTTNLSIFEDSCAVLKAKLSDLAESEQASTATINQ
jgi:hypothetical protein